MNDNEFFLKQQEAIERMKEMNSRSLNGNMNSHTMPPVPPFVKIPPQANDDARKNTDSYNKNHTEPTRGGANTHASENRGKTPLNNNATPLGLPFLGGINLPFTDIFKKDSDITLIIGLLLILMSEKADKKLLFALVYILM